MIFTKWRDIVKEKIVRGYEWTEKLIAQYRSLAVMAVYAVFYLIAFYYLEQRTVAVHEINFKIDAHIPFCEVFIVPYLLWFGYVAITVVFLCIKDKEESDRLVAFLIAGMTIFIVISAVFPNGHNLRPTTFPRENIFIDLIRHLYATDTPTNILPSIHVYNSIGIHLAVSHNEQLKKNKTIQLISFILMTSIILATMFIKQHSVFDVSTALVLAYVMYRIVYRHNWSKSSLVSRIKARKHFLPDNQL